ncbi:hypothetical protein [Massilia sp. Se16.2.3]|uniref:hypothetical protein n=1 Tax=Massilia sp. Se16.2.3 TaxID=2709303 RepID=UPI001E5B0C4A|nr:hypothetical protein [Massilia sp. Se16.2.3]
MLVGDEAVAIVAGEAALPGKPHEAGTVLENRAHRWMGQAAFDTELLEAQLPGRRRMHEAGKQQEQAGQQLAQSGNPRCRCTGKRGQIHERSFAGAAETAGFDDNPG